jgi:hypothetical protein
MACPADFELRTLDGAPRCVNKDDPDVSIHLIPQSAVIRPIDDHSMFSVEELKSTNPDAYARYSTEFERFTAEKAVAMGKIDHDKQVKAASAAVLAAAGKDQATVDTAAAKYLEVTGDPDAAAYTIDRGIKTELGTTTRRFVEEYQFLSNQSKQQQDTMDLIATVKDNLFMVKDDLEFSVGTFDKQVSDIQNQINKNKRIHEQAIDYGAWMLFGLNISVIFALLFALFVLGRVVMTKVSGSSGSSGTPTRNPSEHTSEFFRSFDDYVNARLDAAERPAKRGWLW